MELGVLWEMLVTEPLEKRRYREAHKDSPWVFLIYHGLSILHEGEDVTNKVLESSALSRLDGVTSIMFDGAPHNIPPGETYFSWFSKNIEAIAKKRGRFPTAILDADYFNRDGVVYKTYTKYDSHIQNLIDWSEKKNIKFMSISREELFQN